MPESVGTAYLNVVPKVQGSGADLGSEFGSGFGGKMQGAISAASVACGNLLSNMASKAASAVGDTFKQAFSSFADFEQLEGGVQKIFDKADTAKIMADAKNAYKDLNMSANEYLDSVNAVGATFAQTMGDQKGYDTAREGMKAIADFASGTGKSVEELNQKYQLISRSAGGYQSIADQFAGVLPQTSADFLAQAQAAGLLEGSYKKLTEVPVAEYQQAVTGMLAKGVEDMGLAGNTLAESTQTISGSLAMLKGSWDNFLVSFASGDSEAMTAAVGNLLESLQAAVTNSLPVVQNMLTGMWDLAIQALGGEDSAMGGALGSVANAVAGAIPSLQAAGQQLIGVFTQIGTTVTSVLAPLLTAVAPIVGSLVSIVGTAAQTIGSVLSTVVGFVQANVVPLFQEVLAAFSPELQAIAADVQGAFTEIQSAVSTVMGAVSSVMGAAWPAIKAVVSTVMKSIVPIVRTAWSTIKTVISTAVGAIKTVIGGIRSVVGVVKGVFDSVKSAITGPIEAAKNTVKGIVDKIVGFFHFSVPTPHIPVPHFSISPAGWKVGDLLKGKIPTLGISWAAKGGWYTDATLLGVGERGGEFVWPSYQPYLDRYADALASRMQADPRELELLETIADRCGLSIGDREARKLSTMQARYDARNMRRAEKYARMGVALA